MELKRITLIVILISAVILLVLAFGCGPTPTPTATPAPTAAPSPTAAPKPTAAPSPSPAPSPTAVPSPTAALKPVKLVISSYGGATYNHRLGMERAMDLITQRSNGLITWNYFPGAALFTLNDAFVAMKNGIADIAMGTFGGVDKSLVGPLYYTSSPPFGMDPQKVMDHWRDPGGYYDTGEAILNKNNVHYIAMPRVGWNDLYSRVQVQAMGDWKGLMVRTAGGLAPSLAALGGSPVVMDLSDLYTALSRKTIDAAACSASNYISNKLWEVAPYVIECHLYSGNLDWIMNLQTYKSLDPSFRKIVDDAFREAEVWVWTQCRDVWNAADRVNIESKGAKYIAIPADELAKWKTVGQKPYFDTFQKDFPAEFPKWKAILDTLS